MLFGDDDLMTVTGPDGNFRRFRSMEDATKFARSHNEGSVVLEVYPRGGGIMTSLAWDWTLDDWVPTDS